MPDPVTVAEILAKWAIAHQPAATIQARFPELLRDLTVDGEFTCPRCRRTDDCRLRAQVYLRRDGSLLILCRGPVDTANATCHLAGVAVPAAPLHRYLALQSRLLPWLEAPSAIAVAGATEALLAAYDLRLRFGRRVPLHACLIDSPVPGGRFARAVAANLIVTHLQATETPRP